LDVGGSGAAGESIGYLLGKRSRSNGEGGHGRECRTGTRIRIVPVVKSG
jgi:hypothetical protein